MPVPTTYDLSGFENMTGLQSLATAADHVIFNGMLGIILLIGLSVIIFTLSYKSTNSTSKSFLATSFIVFILSLIGWGTGIISEHYMWGTLCIFVLSLAMTGLTRE